MKKALLSNRFTLPLMAMGALCAAVAQATPDYPTTITNDNAVAYYRLEELPGASDAADSSGNGLDATYNYSTTTNSPELGLPGIDTNSILFFYGTGGPSDFGNVDIPFDQRLAPVNADGQTGAAFSAECWAEPTSQSLADYTSPLAMSGPYTTGIYQNASGWNFYQTEGSGSSAGSWSVFMRTSGGVQGLSGPAITVLQWYHLVVTFDGTNAVFYVNGVAQTTEALTGYLADNGSDGSIGSGPQTGHGAFVGGVDEVAFYTNALTAAQVLNHYTIGTNSFRVQETAPAFVSAPTSTTNYSGTEVTFTALVSGSTPLYYQWSRGATPIPGQTNNTYSFVPTYPADDGATFSVSVSNAVGNIDSGPITLTVLTNLNIIGPPYSITRNSNSYAAFRVAVSGAMPITYQWSVSTDGGNTSTPLVGQTSDTLWLTNVQMSMNGNVYSVVVGNPFLSNSFSATLNVQPRSVIVPLYGYAKIVAADHPVAYWRLDEPTGATVATDAVGSFDGTYNDSLGPITWGIPGAIPHDPDTAVDLSDPQESAIGQGGVVDVPYALEINPYGPWSFEGWVKPDSNDPDGNFRTIFSSMYNSNFSAATFGWIIYQHPASAFTLVTLNGSGGPAFFGSDFGHIPLSTNTWYHLVLTDDGTNIQLYVNGIAGSATTSAANFAQNGINGDPSLGAGPTVMGQRSDGAFFGFSGGVDEVASYKYALTPAQVALHYATAPSLSVTHTGNSITIDWAIGTLEESSTVNGPYVPVSGASSPYTTSATGAQMFYRLQL